MITTPFSLAFYFEGLVEDSPWHQISEEYLCYCCNVWSLTQIGKSIKWSINQSIMEILSRGYIVNTFHRVLICVMYWMLALCHTLLGPLFTSPHLILKQFDVMNYYGYFPSLFILLIVFIDVFLTFPLSPVLTLPN